MRRAQMWSADFALSVLIFTAAVLVSYSIITNTIEDSGFQDVRRQATDAAELLIGTGFPEHWTNDTVIRAGILSNDRLSVRKAEEMERLTLSQLRKSLRTTDYIYIYATNNMNDTVSIFGTCGLGDTTIPGVMKNGTLPAMAIVDTHPFSDNLENITIYEDDAGFSHIQDADVIVIEQNFSKDTVLSDSYISRELDEATGNGITVLVIGDPGISILGIETAWKTAEELQVQGTAGERLGLTNNEVLEIDELVEIPTLSSVGLDNFKAIALTDIGDVAYATWTYNDARVWYLATADGDEDDVDLFERLTNSTQSFIHVPRPECTDFVTPPDAKQVAFHDRFIPYHDTLLRARVVVWRTQ